ncbi:N-lysine methyltransferase KMT5A-A-like isoform X2 [Hoplias malabaricus]
MTGPEQQTLHSFTNRGNTRSPHRKSPLFPILEENSSARKDSDTSKEVSVTGGVQPKQENSGIRILSSPREKTCSPQDEEKASEVVPNKTESVPHAKSKVSKPTHKRAENTISPKNRKVTDYFPIRRSSRKSKAELKCEEQRHIDDVITNNVEEGLKVKHIEGKGRGVFAEREFHKGQFIVEYHGDLIQLADAKKREAQYAQDPTKGCYMYYFQHLSKNYCVDATKESGRLGRLINHSKNGNCQTRIHDLNGVPHLILVAARDIKTGEELLYDYGDRSKEAIAAHPWLKH